MIIHVEITIGHQETVCIRHLFIHTRTVYMQMVELAKEQSEIKLLIVNTLETCAH